MEWSAIASVPVHVMLRPVIFPIRQKEKTWKTKFIILFLFLFFLHSHTTLHLIRVVILFISSFAQRQLSDYVVVVGFCEIFLAGEVHHSVDGVRNNSIIKRKELIFFLPFSFIKRWLFFRPSSLLFVTLCTYMYKSNRCALCVCRFSLCQQNHAIYIYPLTFKIIRYLLLPPTVRVDVDFITELSRRFDLAVHPLAGPFIFTCDLVGIRLLTLVNTRDVFRNWRLEPSAAN